jgi:putative membrane protein
VAVLVAAAHPAAGEEFRTMGLINDYERTQIAAAIAEVERHTDAELVTVLAARSDDYRYIPVLWAAIAALLLPAPLVLTAMTALDVLSIQLGVFCALIVVFRIPQVARRLIPEPVRQWRASNMARRQFLEQGLHHTRAETGVLIFVSEAERYVEVLADRGVSEHVDDERWQVIVDRFVADVKQQRILRGFIDAIAASGEILAEAVPKTPDNRNELADRLILIGYD